MTDFSDSLTHEQKARVINKDFKKARAVITRGHRSRERSTAAQLHKSDQTFSMVTHNVNGFGTSDLGRDSWLRTLRRSDQHGRQDICFLQETHIEAAEIRRTSDAYAAQWGYRTGRNSPPISFWSAAEERRGGVAILIDPYGAFKDATPYAKEHWSPHFMAVTGKLDGVTVVAVNIYAPHMRAQREGFFERLMHVEFPSGACLAVGGDFNCTLDDKVDRSYQSDADHDSPMLRNLLAQWGVLDPIATARPTAWTAALLALHQAETHTYFYTVPGFGEASSRLDKWYVSAALHEWVAGSETIIPGVKADHKGVRLHLISPTDPTRICKPARIHPVPHYAQDAVKQHTTELLQRLLDRVTTESMSPAESAAAWDKLKQEIAKTTLQIKRQRRKTVRRGLQQKMRRLLRQQARLFEEQRGASPTVDSVTDLLDGLTMEEGVGPTRAARLRRAIAKCKEDRDRVKQQRLFGQGVHWTGKTTKAFFRRISSKFQDNTIRRLDPVDGAPARGVHDKADILADAWSPIFQQKASPTGDVDEVVGWMEQGPLISKIAETITEAEVLLALRACKSGKAAGPDQLGNDWYLEYQDVLVPLLTALLRSWYAAGVFPQSFLRADIFCLKKGGNHRNALNYRPLALLNTDYKIFTRILATRVRDTLADRIHPTQNGFVPGRTIHDTLHLYEAAQKMVLADPDQEEAIAMLLDFKKAYDSLDRSYLYAVLRRHGYPDTFIKTVEALHNGTTVQFLANGTKSRPVTVTSGIRQGCPLAPMLFILALDPLYRRLDREDGIRGVVIQSEAGRMELRVAGYADDTAVYLNSSAEVEQLQDITHKFGRASGLRLNAKKTVIIALSRQGIHPEPELPGEMAFQDPTTACRYLGIQVGSNVEPAKSWDVADSQLRARLHLACLKTTTVDQRSLIAASVIIPKLTFIAQHAWPSTETVNIFNKKIKNFIWHATFSVTVGGARAWLNADLAALDRAQGGLDIPDLRTEIMAMAAAAVSSWALHSTCAMHIVGDVLLQPSIRSVSRKVVIFPNSLPPPETGLRKQSTMWATGKMLVTLAGGSDLTPEHVDMIQRMVQAAEQPDALVIRRDGQHLMVTGENLLTTDACRRLRRMIGNTAMQCLEWLPDAPINDLRLCQSDGQWLRVTEVMASFSHSKKTLAAFFSWSLVCRGVLRFTLTPTALSIAPTISVLALSLVANFPNLLLRSYPQEEVRFMASPADHPLTVIVNQEREVSVRSAVDVIEVMGVASSAADLQQKIVTAGHPDVHIQYVHPHPRISRLACLWVGHRRWSRSRHHYKSYIASASNKRGLEERDVQLDKWRVSSADAAKGLSALEWRHIRKIIGIGPWGEQVIYRLKLNALSLYDMRNERLGCPHSTCAHVRDVTTHHIFWTCPAAKKLRAVFVRRWVQLGMPELRLEQACFGLDLEQVPPGIWTVMEKITADMLLKVRGLDERVTQLVESCWRLGAALYFHGVWKWRIQHFDDNNDVSARYHCAVLRSRLQIGYRTMPMRLYPGAVTQSTDVAAKVMQRALTGDTDDIHPGIPEGSSNYLLFFDGGSRGNPGPGGSGATVVRLGADGCHFHVVWAGSMSYNGSTTTNNLAENLGLLTGLRACAHFGYSPLHIIGDSAMIIRQHRTRRPPQAAHLAPLYWRSRRHASKLRVLSWNHHVREYNKMADRLANMAMDSKRSIQTTQTGDLRSGGLWTMLQELAVGDVSHWLAHHNNMDEHDHLPAGL